MWNSEQNPVLNKIGLNVFGIDQFSYLIIWMPIHIDGLNFTIENNFLSKFYLLKKIRKRKEGMITESTT